MSAAAELIENLTQHGVNLKVEGDDLIIRAPKGAVPPEALEQLKAQKIEVMAELVDRPGAKQRRERVLEMMDQDPNRQRAWFADDGAHSNYVPIAFANRDQKGRIQTCEFTIEREKRDPQLFFEKANGGGTDS